jgi:hypothetical protein
VINKEAIDFSKADAVLAGKYKRPAAKIDPNTKKLASYLDKLVSKPFGYSKLEDFLNHSGPIEPEELGAAIDVMSNSVFELNDGEPFYNLIVRSNKYKDEGVALAWEGNQWSAG